MIVALTGTPGTGKTSVCRILRKKFPVVSLNNFVAREKLYCGYDMKRKVKIVDLKKLNKKIVSQQFQRANIVIIESHYSHLLSCISKVIVLRCRPNVLKKRLRQKYYSQKKIQENVEAEAVDSITIESVQLKGKNNVFEIDTTNKTLEEVADTLFFLLSCLSIRKLSSQTKNKIASFRAGTIDWSEDILGWF